MVLILYNRRSRDWRSRARQTCSQRKKGPTFFAIGLRLFLLRFSFYYYASFLFAAVDRIDVLHCAVCALFSWQSFPIDFRIDADIGYGQTRTKFKKYVQMNKKKMGGRELSY